MERNEELADDPLLQTSPIKSTLPGESDGVIEMQPMSHGRLNPFNHPHLPAPAVPPQRPFLYTLCHRCRPKYETKSWQPSFWVNVCPFPYCPSFREFSRIMVLVIVGIILWLTLYIMVGNVVAPQSQLFGLFFLVVSAHIGGWAFNVITTLPKLIGMLSIGILYSNLGWVNLEGDFTAITSQLRKIALVIILIRAGLEMNHKSFQEIKLMVLKLAIIPWLVELIAMAVLVHFFLEMPWSWAFAAATVVSAISPAVVVPCLIRCKEKGFGVAKGIPTLVIAVAGINDATAVALFGIVTTIIFSADDLYYQIAQGPICIVGGVVFALAWGYLSKYVPEKGDKYLVSCRVCMTFAGGCLAVFGSKAIGFEGAGPLGVVFAAFISNYFWCQQGSWDVEHNTVATVFEICWIIFEPILFSVTGASVMINRLEIGFVMRGVLMIASVVLLRIVTTMIITYGDNLNVKERVFVSVSLMAKATVQAALATVCLKNITEESTNSERWYAEVVFMLAVLSIVVTAPIGAIFISTTAKRLLVRTRPVAESSNT